MPRIHCFSLICAAAFIACFATACAQQQPAAPPDTRADDEATIRAADADFVKAAAAKDLEKAMSYYADDAVFLSSGAPAAVARYAIPSGRSKLGAKVPLVITPTSRSPTKSL